MEGGWWEGVDDLDNGLTMEEVVGTRFWLKEDGIEGVIELFQFPIYPSNVSD